VSEALRAALIRGALDAVEPRRRTCAAIASASIDRPVTLLAFGKASRAMAAGALDAVSVAQGIVLSEDDSPLGGLRVVRAAHPTPALDAAERADEVLALARSLGPDDVALVLVSGGGSSMLERPASGVSIGDVGVTVRALLRAGASIDELNAVRRAISLTKGGGLARALAPARVVVIVISDVPGHPPSLVASGPCAAIEPGAPDPQVVLERYRDAPIPASVRVEVGRGDRAPLPGEVLAKVETIVAAANADALEGARRAAEEHGVTLVVETEVLAGDAREAALRFAARGRAAAPAGLVAGGETTVRVSGTGRGGRNQHAALALGLAGLDGATFLALGTDGIDGDSSAAGAWIDDAIVARGRKIGLEPATWLARADSAGYFDAVGTAIVTGPTGTNVGDIWIWLPE
jgi:glycerate 2-kinase